VGVKYFYNAAGQLIMKRVNGTPNLFMLWDRGNPLADLGATASSKVVEYSYLPGMDMPHAFITSGRTWYPHQDALGNVIVVNDSVGGPDRTYQYDDWGKLSGGSDNLPFSGVDRLRWKGALWYGNEANLYYMRNRWYDPESGRFLSEDPLGTDGGLNVYLFGRNNPVDNADPLGLRCTDWYRVTVYYSEGKVVGRTETYVSTTCAPGGGGGPPPGEIDQRTHPGARNYNVRPRTPLKVPVSLPCSGDTYFSGFSLDLVAVGGFTFAFGQYMGPASSGLYVRLGTSTGIDVSAGLEAGFQRGFEGKSVELQAGAGPLAFSRATGGGKSLSYGIGLPFSVRGGVVNTSTFPSAPGYCKGAR
jgi:RHS repeat-associated protein